LAKIGKDDKWYRELKRGKKRPTLGQNQRFWGKIGERGGFEPPVPLLEIRRFSKAEQVEDNELQTSDLEKNHDSTAMKTNVSYIQNALEVNPELLNLIRRWNGLPEHIKKTISDLLKTFSP